ncbi:MAG: hypothetical protein LAN70_16175 [Acidobacteriia bacterium]|nr:hypothetical protein [Terriglobia bacterium]
MQEYFIHEQWGAGLRRVEIHLAPCRKCKALDKTDPPSAQEVWHGPFDDLASARVAASGLPANALLSECRCVYRALEGNALDRVLLADLSLRRSKAGQAPDDGGVLIEYPPARISRRRKPQRKRPRHAAGSAKRSKGSPSSADSRRKRKALILACLSVALLMVVGGALSLLPSLSVEELPDSSRTYAASFVFSNGSPFAITHVVADCNLEFAPAGVHIEDAHVNVADRLEFKRHAPISCLSGSVPQSGGMKSEVTVSYKILGIRRVQQKFLFTAGRSTTGIQRWMYLR